METVAFYGAGRLGSGMVRAMLRRGVAVRLWNRSPEKARAHEEHGAQTFVDAAEAATGADRVHLCLNDDVSVDAVIEAALPGVAAETPIVDHTTVLPQRVVERTRRLTDAGHAFMHAPVFMGPHMALSATGVMLASGDGALFERLRPALETMCSDLRYLGDLVLLVVARGSVFVTPLAHRRRLPMFSNWKYRGGLFAAFAAFHRRIVYQFARKGEGFFAPALSH